MPKSNNPDRISLNTQSVVLEEGDFAAVEGLRAEEGTEVRMNDSRYHIGFDIYNEEVEEPVDVV